MTDTITEDEKAEMLEMYKIKEREYDAILGEMKANGYIRDLERERDRNKLLDRLNKCGSKLRTVDNYVEWAGLRFIEENGEMRLRDRTPEMSAERVREFTLFPVADEFDDDIPF